MKRWISVLLSILVALSLCSCGGAGQNGATKGESLSTLIELSEENTEAEQVESEPAPMGWNEELTSASGDVTVSIHDDAFDSVPETMPVNQVQPLTITAAMARQAASALFGDAPLYEYGWELSRAEIQRRIDGMERGITDAAIRDSYGENISDEQLEHIRAIRQAILDDWREAWAHAPEEVSPRECDWLFRPMEYFEEFSHDYTADYPTYTDSIPFGVSAMLRTQGEIDGQSYQFWVHNLERDDFWDHSISLFLDSPTVMNKTDLYASTGHMSTVPATDAELRQAERDAEALMARMGFGDWRCEAEVAELLDEKLEPNGLYYIRLTGFKLREGWTTLFKGSEDGPADGGYTEHASLERSNDGMLLDFDLCGLLEDGSSETVPLISTDEAMDAAREAMARWTVDDHIHYLYFEDEQPGALRREVTEIRVGQYRAPKGERSYELFPVLAFLGTERIEGVTEICNEYECELELLLIDLRDGSVIDP